uniref:Zinc finger and BTB domain containing 6 n=2 Tax=Gasterosteus aculeatus aculeatus TaxID=481459 RepID=A0AAQ4RUJ5_GASAC|nr:zinc finger and BTB domain-containing protein 6-like isoform X2 [Gasterosteus aculeatus aculeatus]
MSSSRDTLRFRFPAHGDSILSKINTLRQEQRFCDVTLLLGDPRDASGQPLHFHAHRAVLAVSSDFLRDQFLLHGGRAKLCVGVVCCAEVGKRLLLSCYTGLLEVPLRDLVSYLTAASALQMSQVVERCSQAISQYLGPTLALKPAERHSEEKDNQQPDSDQPGTSSGNQEEKDALLASISVQEASTVEEVKSMSRFGKGAMIGSRMSEEAGDMKPANTNQPPYQAQQVTGALRCCSPTAFEDHISPTTDLSSARCKKTVRNIQNQEKDAEEGQREEGKLFLLEAQPQECGEPRDTHLFSIPGENLPKSFCLSGDELEGRSDSTSSQRPYLCRRCDRVFQHLESYLGHLKPHRQYLCLVCGKGFSQRINLVRHIRAHTGVKPFRCPLCHKTFSQKATLQDHFNLHTGDQSHKCRYCGVLFQHKVGLRRHLKDIHGSGPQNND